MNTIAACSRNTDPRGNPFEHSFLISEMIVHSKRSFDQELSRVVLCAKDLTRASSVIVLGSMKSHKACPLPRVTDSNSWPGGTMIRSCGAIVGDQVLYMASL